MNKLLFDQLTAQATRIAIWLVGCSIALVTGAFLHNIFILLVGAFCLLVVASPKIVTFNQQLSPQLKTEASEKVKPLLQLSNEFSLLIMRASQAVTYYFIGYIAAGNLPFLSDLVMPGINEDTLAVTRHFMLMLCTVGMLMKMLPVLSRAAVMVDKLVSLNR